MIIEVKVKTSSKKISIEKKENIFLISLKSKPKDNKANSELIGVISSYFNVPKSSVNISLGLKNKRKLIEISDI